ncbi:hypothetical protein G9A89_008628 [Geosiphon pyriformis]|nr:hypothetical protein G9A89_008628 [Geosiphon pyriformis]
MIENFKNNYDNLTFVSLYLFSKKADSFIDVQQREIITYFKGPELSFSQWKERHTQLIPANNYTFGEPVRNMAVDSEFHHHFQVIKPELFQRIEIYLNLLFGGVDIRKSTNVIFTGHGAGGAYATLAALAFKTQYSEVNSKIDVLVATFGQPRVLSSSLARLANKKLRIVRVTHTNDYHPHFPVFNHPSEFLEHQEREFWISYPFCDCSQKDQVMYPFQELVGEYPLYSCPGDESSLRKYSGENKQCNAGQKGTEDQGLAAHYGPYFGIMMNVCWEYMDELPFNAFWPE